MTAALVAVARLGDLGLKLIMSCLASLLTRIGP